MPTRALIEIPCSFRARPALYHHHSGTVIRREHPVFPSLGHANGLRQLRVSSDFLNLTAKLQVIRDRQDELVYDENNAHRKPATHGGAKIWPSPQASVCSRDPP